MTKSGFSYLKLTAVVAVLGIALIGLNGLLGRTTVAREKSTTTPGEIASTPEQKFSEEAATVLATERDTTTPTLPVSVCEFSGVQITALELTQGVADDRVDVGWDFSMPQQLAALGTCVFVDHFDVNVTVTYGDKSKQKFENAIPLARNAVVRFPSLLKKATGVKVDVQAVYKVLAISKAHREK